MRKIIVIIFFCSFAKAQHIPFAGSITQQTNNWIATLGTYPSGRVLYALNNFIAVEKYNGNYSTLINFWLFAQDVEANAKIGLITGATVTAVNSPTWTAYEGYASNGTTSYVNTNIFANNMGATFHQYLITNLAIQAGSGAISSNITWYSMRPKWDDGNMSGMIGFGTSDFVNTFTPVSNSTGLKTVFQVNSTATKLYDRGLQIYSGSMTNAFVPISVNIYICAVNDARTSSTPFQFDTRNNAITFSTTTAVNMTFLNNDIQALATALGFAQ